MKNNNRTKLNFKWLEGFTVDTPHNKFLAECLGKSIWFFFRAWSVYLIIKAIAPNGLIH
jgi:hypothetical protein